MQTLQEIFACQFAGDVEFAPVDGADLNVVALLQVQRGNNRGRQTDRKTIAPFRDLHALRAVLHSHIAQERLQP